MKLDGFIISINNFIWSSSAKKIEWKNLTLSYFCPSYSYSNLTLLPKRTFSMEIILAEISKPFFARYNAVFILYREKGRQTKLTTRKNIRRTISKDFGSFKKGINIRIINDQKQKPIKKSLMKSSFITFLFLLFFRYFFT